jgi:hypothetical protein
MDPLQLTGLWKGRDKQGNACLSGKAIMLIVVSYLMFFLLQGCGPSKIQRFCHENIMKIHKGMTPQEIATIFGKPDTIEMRSVGPPQVPNPCRVMMYSYDIYPGWGKYYLNSFGFVLEPKPHLIYWKVTAF